MWAMTSSSLPVQSHALLSKLQFIGHAFEGKKPSFFSDPRFLLIGVAYFIDKGRALLGMGKGQAPGS